MGTYKKTHNLPQISKSKSDNCDAIVIKLFNEFTKDTKYENISESFDRYEFGEYGGDYDTLSLEYLYNDIKTTVIEFGQPEIRIILDIIGSYHSAMVTTSIAGRMIRFTNQHGNEYTTYELYHLGDYVYCVLGIYEYEEIGEMPRKEVSYFEIFDGFDDVVEFLKKLLT